jgi:hypothetical protein
MKEGSGGSYEVTGGYAEVGEYSRNITGARLVDMINRRVYRQELWSMLM